MNVDIIKQLEDEALVDEIHLVQQIEERMVLEGFVREALVLQRR